MANKKLKIKKILKEKGKYVIINVNVEKNFYYNRHKNMERTILSETHFFIICVVSGFIVVMLYDILEWFRSIIKHNKVIETVEDLLYGICTGFRLFVVVYKYNDGILRAFLIIAIIIGICGYHFFKKFIWWIKQKIKF